ncbi:MAG: outer membrane lipoprotein carrier protein LolA, partial [Saprospiraceae bacterium]|nr:outer membrane lipoprotein carrier protein LolA [Saprospiraceae bacterium]
MYKLLIPLLTLFFVQSLSAQPGQAKPEKNDPEAKAILDKVRKKYEGYKSMEAAFALNIEVPGQPVENQKGTVAQQGDKFKLEMDAQTLVSDGKTTWVYLKNNKEIQINDADGGTGDFLTPKELLSRYQRGDYLYAIMDKVNEGGKVLTQIEFKPKDRNSEYSKMRVNVDEKTQTIQSIKA